MVQLAVLELMIVVGAVDVLVILVQLVSDICSCFERGANRL